MSKRKYYVSVQAGTIMSGQGDAAYELEIEASEAEKADLERLFGTKTSFDDASYFRTHVPGVPYHLDEENDGYDHTLKDIYKLLYELGTEETKQHIATMHILE